MANESIPFSAFIAETASEHVCRLVPVAQPRASARELRQSLEGVHFESATHIGVCEAGKLVGVLRVEELFSALGDQRIGDIMDADPPVVGPGIDQEKAAWKAVQGEKKGTGYFSVKDWNDRPRLLFISRCSRTSRKRRRR